LYKALTSNCTTGTRRHILPYKPDARLDSACVNGHVDKMIYERGILSREMPFVELKKAALSMRRPRRPIKPIFPAFSREGLPEISLGGGSCWIF
jgi:hypothetical protein